MREIGHFAGGKRVEGKSGRFADVFAPHTGEVQARVSLASSEEVNGIVANAKALAQTLGDKTAIILFGHGVAVTGPTLPTAVSNAYFLNMNARVEEQAIRLGGTVSYLEREPGAKRPSNVEAAGAAANNRAWEYWKRQVAAK